MAQIDPDTLDLDALESQLQEQLDQAEFDPKMGKHAHLSPATVMALLQRCKGAEVALQEAGQALQDHLDEE